MWATQCHKPSIWGWLIPPIYGDDLGMFFYWVSHTINDPRLQKNTNHPPRRGTSRSPRHPLTPAPSWMKLAIPWIDSPFPLMDQWENDQRSPIGAHLSNFPQQSEIDMEPKRSLCQGSESIHDKCDKWRLGKHCSRSRSISLVVHG